MNPNYPPNMYPPNQFPTGGAYPPSGYPPQSNYPPQSGYPPQQGYQQPGYPPQQPPRPVSLLPYHIHPLTDAHSSNKMCDICGLNINGPSKQCSQCKIFICPKCAELIVSNSETIKNFHPHQLKLEKQPQWTCNVCQMYKGGYLAFNCRSCNYNVCISCLLKIPQPSQGMQPPYPPGAQQPPYPPGAQQPPYQPGMKQPPYQPGMQPPPYQPGMQPPPYQPGMQPPYQPGMQQPPYQPGMQQPPYQQRSEPKSQGYTSV